MSRVSLFTTLILSSKCSFVRFAKETEARLTSLPVSTSSDALINVCQLVAASVTGQSIEVRGQS